jgi:hypothetical protein
VKLITINILAGLPNLHKTNIKTEKVKKLIKDSQDLKILRTLHFLSIKIRGIKIINNPKIFNKVNSNLKKAINHQWKDTINK